MAASTTRNHRTTLTALFVACAALLAACPDDKVVVDNLFLEVTSDAPAAGKIESLRILFQKNGVHFPESPSEAAFNPSLGSLDPAAAPVTFSIAYNGDTFGDGQDVVVNVTGRIGGVPVVRFEGEVDLADKAIVKVHLKSLPGGCDGDGDGFLDCDRDGCCEAGTVFGDCGDDDPNTSPWAVEAECEACSDEVDQDCNGGDQPCIDEDGDAIADCAETCGRGDPFSGPGKAEICDGKDNDCDGQTDEGLTFVYFGEVLDLGDECGLGACAGGSVECNGQGGLRCSNDGERAAVEDCATAADDNCNGHVNEGCVAGDFDGDGVSVPADCNDHDAGVYPGRTGEPCCPVAARGDEAAEAACDLNCDGEVAFCEAGDADGDGVTVAEGDCDDGDATVAPGKPEKCGDGVDQDCAGGDVACEGLIDADGDHWAASVDCDDGDPAVRPDAAEACNGRDDDCDFAVDEGNPGGGAQCGATDVGDCAFGVEQCQNSLGVAGQIVCVGAIAAKDAETCDGHDEDCDGATDEDFTYEGREIGATCDGVGACGAGRVECAPGRSDVATCSTNADGSASEASAEVCDDADNDCDGELNEGVDDVAASDCLNAGVCADNRELIVAHCGDDGVWQCDYSNVPGYEGTSEASCDALDNDCDGEVNEDFAFVEAGGAVRGFGLGCDGGDADQCRNGLVGCDPEDAGKTACVEVGGPIAEVCDGADNDCDGDVDEDFRDTASNRVVLAGALFGADNGAFLGDACGTGACGGGAVVCDGANALRCSTDPRVGNGAAPADTCDGVDNDCDGATDESFVAGGTVKLQGALFSGDNGKAKGQACGSGECAGGTVVCATLNTLSCSSDGEAVSGDACNGLDDDCDGTTDDDFVATTGPNRKPLAGALFAADNGKVKGATCGTGECSKVNGQASPGQVACNAAGTALVCTSDARATTDTCDGLDNDCDGASDDPYLAGGTVSLTGAKLAADNGKVKGATCGAGSCANGHVVCAANKTSLVCDSETKATTDVCDNVDNDCDGTRDEDYKYDNKAIGQSCDGVGGCGVGTVVCAVGSNSSATCSTNPNGTAPQDSTETCDGVDNDCNGGTDEGFTYQAKALGEACIGIGECGAGTVVCSVSDATRATCSSLPDGTASQASNEACNGDDDDCDGATDEDFTYQGDGVGEGCDGIGHCGAGVVECAGAGAARCSTNPGGSDDESLTETCNAQDDDCDGATDDGFSMVDDAGQTRQVGQSCEGVGECGTGAVECATVSTARCSSDVGGSATQATAEICDTFDNDCDGDIDEDFAYETIPVASTCDGIGACGDGIVQCADDHTAVCSSNPNGTASQAVAETCDSLDNDCDTQTDEGFTYTEQPGGAVRAIGAACNGIGACGTGVVECDTPSVATCSTDPNGSVHQDVAESCDAVDNDCDAQTDEGLADIDEDTVCDDGLDGCVDVDGDDIGRDPTAEQIAAGVEYSHADCSLGGAPYSGVDCNDEAFNGEDLDGDNVCNDGIGSVCTSGATASCDDNCPDLANATQTDANGNGVGDACDFCATAGQGEPFEVCDNCLDDDCSGATTDTTDCAYRRVLQITTGASGVPIDYSLSFTFDHAFLVAANRSNASGADVRVFWRNPSTKVFSEVDRVLDPESSWNSTTTKIWFRSMATFTATSTPNADYYLYYYKDTPTGAPVVLAHTDKNAFLFADFFDRGDAAAVGGDWTEQEDGGSLAVGIAGNALEYTTTVNNRTQTPAVKANFSTFEQSSGRVLVRTRWNWARVGTADDDFSVAMQVGSFTSGVGAGNSNQVLDHTNVIATLAWGQKNYSMDSVAPELALTKGDSKTSISSSFTGAGVVDLTVDFGTKRLAVDPDGDGATAATTNVTFDADTSLKGIRFFTGEVDAGTDKFSARKFDYVYLRKLPPLGEAEPVVKTGGFERLAPRCALDTTGLVARYHLDDPRDDPDGDEAMTVRNMVGDVPQDLTRETATCGLGCVQPEWIATPGPWGLRWLSRGGGSVGRALSGTDFMTGGNHLDGSTQVTVELVAALAAPGAADPERFLFDLADGTAERLALSVSFADSTSNARFRLYYNDVVVNAWTAALGAGWDRTVLHVVVDADNATAASRYRLYRDGALMTADGGFALTAGGELDLGVAPMLRLGNSDSNDQSPVADLFYAAFYNSADSNIVKNAPRLLANDDRR